mmetsp:Transcript_7794/g.23862  ORF Transcript_7794/g.23862 Transcript_7794/m.23862 type:complete len:253 (-) Transcript_7794:71-829(-)
MALSKSSPPRKVSPLVAFTSNTPPEISRMDTSNVPPPRSYTATTPSLFSTPYASAAAVGSLMMRSTSSPAIRPASLVAWRCESLKYAGTVTTACVTLPPRCFSAVSFILPSTKAPTCEGEYFSPRASSHASPLSALTTLYGTVSISRCVCSSSNVRPMRRLVAKSVPVGLVTACRLAGMPTSRSPLSVNATTDGVVRAPSRFSITLALLPSITATHELVVPRSMPITVPRSSSARTSEPAAAAATRATAQKP